MLQDSNFEPLVYSRLLRNETVDAGMAIARINASILGPLERPCLHWVSRHLPQWLLPNHLTLFGLTGAGLAAAGFILSNWSVDWLWLACLGLLMNWFGDSLDGTLARLRNIERPRFGFFVDHTSDLFSQFVIFLSLGLSPCTHFGVACLGLIAFLIAFVYTLIGAHVLGTMRITYFGFGATEIRALLLVGNLLVLAFGIVNLRPWFGIFAVSASVSIHDFVIVCLSLFATLLIAALAFREARKLSGDDPAPNPTRGTDRAGKIGE
jgi:phosphatidylglycerophosphate synthase